MTTKSDQVITLSQINSIVDPNLPKKSIIWKEFGDYLDKKVNIIHNNKGKTNSFLNHNNIDNSYLSQSIEYKICKSCERPIGINSLDSHYPKCVDMKQKRQQEIADNQANNNGSNSSTMPYKKKRKTGVLDIDVSSSVDSTRNNTPIPNGVKDADNESQNNSNNNTSNNAAGKPKKKYKKSQAQKEKEAANAAAAAAAAATTIEKPVKKTKKNSVSNQPSTAPNPVNQSQQKPKTVTKPKGPVDVEKQCGVALPSGGLCARSLTCKTHSMGAKRAVPGRSAPYDVLLQQYQKRNQAKIAQNNALAAQRRENAAFNDDGLDLNLNNANKILDPDEETHLVLEGLSKNNPIPLERKIIMPVRYRHRFLQAREFYANSLIISAQHSQQQQQQHQQTQQSGGGEQQTLANQAISGSIGGLQGRCALINVDAQISQQQDSHTQSFSAIPGEMYQVRAPSKAILMTAQHNNIQQQAFQQQYLKYQQAQQAQQQAQQQQQQMLMRQKQQQQQQQQHQQQQPQHQPPASQASPQKQAQTT
ncbi:uncharacterized protein KGF55_002959 [Candida pseudojiufengensis]|uniref:uncharacterized protein n=1 Tax=Candida pseudojiufengensis TaxID=497109 RepID=UPI002225AD46|nr:uncharacterized protein KGF55_002959 [Candida pseudojiufengensis]KAI5963167.1 hypothetical protein KGF55_002959 [Candida pseudojiufengensis]